MDADSDTNSDFKTWAPFSDPDIGFIDYQDEVFFATHCSKDECPLNISVPFEFKSGSPQSVPVGGTAVGFFTLENPNEEEPIYLWDIKIYCSQPEDSFRLSLTEPPSADSTDEYHQAFVGCTSLSRWVVIPDDPQIVWLSCKPRVVGQHTVAIDFVIAGRIFTRNVVLLAEDEVSQSLAPSSRLLLKRKMPLFSIEPFSIRVLPPYVYNDPPPYMKKHPQHTVRDGLIKLMQNKKFFKVLQQGLTTQNYARFFRFLLIMEEVHLEKEMRCYDMECITMRLRGPVFSVKVPGLAEKRPSLAYGDIVLAKLVSDASNEKALSHQGYIHSVGSDEVFLRFSREFKTYYMKDCSYNIQFTHQRDHVTRLYQAVDFAPKLKENILFPSKSSWRKMIETPLKEITCKLNEEQMHAVETILACRSPPPYVIYGPPGTGKTIILVEAILQLYTSQKDSRVLICAASNSSADHLLELLLGNNVVQVRESDILRLSATSRSYDDVTSDITRFSNAEESISSCPPCTPLRGYRVIISTYSRAACMRAKGIKDGHFTHIFLDDAGQVSEPEAMMPMSCFCNTRTVIVLAGDPMQLGPVVYSSEAESFGLGKSYFERLLEAYCCYEADETNVTKLVRNYRNHPSILALPSKLFYNGTLVACKEDNLITKLVSDLLPNKEFPVIFYGVLGSDEREGDSPSWFNRFEVSRVVEIVKELIRCNVGENDIGVITPYRQQAMKIIKVLEKHKICNVKVGSVEQFQGQEREVIIVSFVRSTGKHAEFDSKFRLGFMNSPTRFNVTITRARSLLVLVGNPHIAWKDANWNELLQYCADNNSYHGFPLPDDDEREYKKSLERCKKYCSDIREPEYDRCPSLPSSSEDEWYLD